MTTTTSLSTCLASPVVTDCPLAVALTVATAVRRTRFGAPSIAPPISGVPHSIRWHSVDQEGDGTAGQLTASHALDIRKRTLHPEFWVRIPGGHQTAAAGLQAVGAGRPMELWQLDVVGGVLLRDGTECKVLTGRRPLSVRGLRRGDDQGRVAGRVCGHFSAALVRYGVLIGTVQREGVAAYVTVGDTSSRNARTASSHACGWSTWAI